MNRADTLTRPPTTMQAGHTLGGSYPAAGALPRGGGEFAPRGKAIRKPPDPTIGVGALMKWGGATNSKPPTSQGTRRPISAPIGGGGGGGGGGSFGGFGMGARPATKAGGRVSGTGKISIRDLKTFHGCGVCGNSTLINGKCELCVERKKLEALESKGMYTVKGFKNVMRELDKEKRLERDRKAQIRATESHLLSQNCQDAGCAEPPPIGPPPKGPRFCIQTPEHIGWSRMDPKDAWEDGTNSEKYAPCNTIVFKPSNVTPNEYLDNTVPDKRLELCHVYGYRGQDCQDNVWWLEDSRIFYFTAAVGVIQDLKKRSGEQQTLFLAHTNDIVSCAVCVIYDDGRERKEVAPNTNNPEDDVPSRVIVATGQVDKYPVIYVWNSRDMSILAKIGGEKSLSDEHVHTRQVRGLAFSRDGSLLASFGYDDSHTVAVHDWARNTPLMKFSRNCHQADVFSIKFNPFSIGEELVTIGDKHIKFWDATVQGGQNGLFGKTRQTQKVLCVTHMPSSQTITGLEDGGCIIWDGGAAVSVFETHPPRAPSASGCTAVKYIDGVGLVTGTRDGVLRLWNLTTRQPSEKFCELGKGNTPKAMDWMPTEFFSDPTPPPLPGSVGARGAPAAQGRGGVGAMAGAIPPDSILMRLPADIRQRVHGALVVGTEKNNIYLVWLVRVPSQTAGAAVYELLPHSRERDLIVAGHSGMLKGLAMHPHLPYAITASEDKTVRFWEYKTKRQIEHTVETELKNTCVDFHSSQGREYMALGHNKAFSMYTVRNPADVTTVTEMLMMRERKEDIEDIRFSPVTLEGNVYLAVASRDNFIDLYDSKPRKVKRPPQVSRPEGLESGLLSSSRRLGTVAPPAPSVAMSKASNSSATKTKLATFLKKSSKAMAAAEDDEDGPSDFLIRNPDGSEDVMKLKKLGTCVGHSSFVTHIDFSKEGALLQSTCGAKELLYWQVPSGAQNPQSQDIKDTEWNSQTAIFGYNLRSIWPPGADGTDINAVAVYTEPGTAKGVVATADDFGHVKLFRYPAIGTKQTFLGYLGHSSHVSNVMFSNDGEYLFSVGGMDHSLFQWRVLKIETHQPDEFEEDFASSPQRRQPQTAQKPAAQPQTQSSLRTSQSSLHSQPQPTPQKQPQSALPPPQQRHAGPPSAGGERGGERGGMPSPQPQRQTLAQNNSFRDRPQQATGVYNTSQRLRVNDDEFDEEIEDEAD